jgi:hypothetical protein
VSLAEEYEDNSEPLPEELHEAAEDVLRQIAESYKAPELAEPEILQNLMDKKEWHGFHAYRYEILSDGSVIALYATEPENLKIKAFADMTEASLWSPRDER